MVSEWPVWARRGQEAPDRGRVAEVSGKVDLPHVPCHEVVGDVSNLLYGSEHVRTGDKDLIESRKHVFVVAVQQLGGLELDVPTPISLVIVQLAPISAVKRKPGSACTAAQTMPVLYRSASRLSNFDNNVSQAQFKLYLLPTPYR